MKSHIIRKAFALLALAAAPALADTPAYEAPLTDDDQLSLACVDVDFAYMTDLDGNLTVDNLYGGTVTIGYTFNATKTSYHKLGFSVGVLYGEKSENSSFPIYTDAEIESFNVLYGTNYTTNDCRYDIHESFTQQIIPLVLEYSYHHAATSDLFVSAGVRAGVMISKTSMKRSYVCGGPLWMSYEGKTDMLIEENHLRIAPVIGVGVGAEYKISDNWKWDVGVNFDFSQSLLRERNEAECAKYGSQVETTDIITTTIHTGFTYSF